MAGGAVEHMRQSSELPIGSRPGLRFERRLQPSRAASILAAVLSALLAFVAGGVVILASGENPLEVYRAMLDGAFGSRTGVAETLVKTIPLLLTGLGVAVAFRMQLWNIGAEGQIYLGPSSRPGSLCSSCPVLPRALFRRWSSAGLVGGALWGRCRESFGVSWGQRDHHEPDAQLRRHDLCRLSGTWRLAQSGRVRLPWYGAVSPRRLAAALGYDPGPPGVDLRVGGSVRRLGHSPAHQVGLRDRGFW